MDTTETTPDLAERKSASQPELAAPSEHSAATKLLTWSSLIIALLQSLCTAVLAVSGIRVVIGLTALAAAAGVDTPAKGYHSDAIRIPMMAVALLGSLVNLYLVWHIRRLRNRSAARWRLAPVSAKKVASERLQIILSILTLLLLAAEWITHPLLHHPPK
jgi:hypothetical protein